ncbi:MAG TPA: glycosyltransferase family A protein [Chitinophagaceae bacterium]|jgi:hypothetical protein|nr:glycosyltransferase family A protein [Chitinophagaceae bacterium]
MNKPGFPKITFGIIVLNGEPFTRYCLRSLYPFAYEIIVVEGGHEDAKSVCTPDGHSIDDTLGALYKFKKEEDPENKVTIVTRDGFWPKKDELGRNRTPQSRAYAERATGDYLWQIDIDEFYREDDMLRILDMLKKDPSITAVSFPSYTFWGDIQYESDSWALKRGLQYCHRIFKWAKGYKYLTHEPSTVVDETGTDLRKKNWVTGKIMKGKDIYMYHYSLLFPWQVEQKVRVYNEEHDNYRGIVDWAENNYFKLNNPYRVHNLFRIPSWLMRHKGKHPDQIKRMMQDIKDGKLNVKLRQNDDVEALLNSFKYKLNRFFLASFEPIDFWWQKFIFNAGRVKNIPGKIKKITRSSVTK